MINNKMKLMKNLKKKKALQREMEHFGKKIIDGTARQHLQQNRFSKD